MRTLPLLLLLPLFSSTLAVQPEFRGFLNTGRFFSNENFQKSLERERSRFFPEQPNFFAQPAPPFFSNQPLAKPQPPSEDDFPAIIKQRVDRKVVEGRETQQWVTLVEQRKQNSTKYTCRIFELPGDRRKPKTKIFELTSRTKTKAMDACEFADAFAGEWWNVARPNAKEQESAFVNRETYGLNDSTISKQQSAREAKFHDDDLNAWKKERFDSFQESRSDGGGWSHTYSTSTQNSFVSSSSTNGPSVIRTGIGRQGFSGLGSGFSFKKFD